MPKFDQAFAAMIEDLAERGMLDNVLVICMSEFGRTPRINGHVGRDHWPEAWSLAMTGCGIRRGIVGRRQTNELGTYVVGRRVRHRPPVPHLVRRARASIRRATEYDNHGQPLPLAHDDCFPIKELLA